MKPTGPELEDLIGQITELTWSYAIWWDLANKENRAAYSKAMEAYPNYFRAVFLSTQQGICVIVARLFDKDSRTLSLRNLVKRLAGSSSALAKQLHSEISSHDQAIEKCKTLRDKVYAHRDTSPQPGDLFKQVGVKPKDFKALVRGAQEIVATLVELHGSNSKSAVLDRFQHCERDVIEETRLIIGRLNDGYESGRREG
jgi:hypothetical protein